MEEMTLTAIPADGVAEGTTQRTGGRAGDAKLVWEARRGSSDAAEEIVRRYWEEAERTAVLIVRDAAAAEDIAQESLLSLLGSLKRFDERRRLRPWLNRIVINRSIDWVRSAAARSAIQMDPLGEQRMAEISDPDLLDALHRLSLADRVAVVMRTVLDYRATEIAEFLGEPAATTRSRIHRALIKLRAELGASAGVER